MNENLYLRPPEGDKHWMLIFQCYEHERIDEVRDLFSRMFSLAAIARADWFRGVNPFFQIGSRGPTVVLGIEFWTTDQNAILDACLRLAEIVGAELDL